MTGAQDAVRTNAPATLASLRAAVHDAHANQDAEAYLRSAVALHTFLNGSPRATLQLAAAQAYAGRQEDALASLRQVVAMGQSEPDTLKGELFSSLRLAKGFQALADSMDLNDAPVSRTQRMCTFKSAVWVPEDIDYDAEGKRFFVTSVLNKDVVILNEDCSFKRFARSPDGWPMMAVKVDGKRKRLWVTDFDPLTSRSSILIYQLDDGSLIKRLAGPAKSALGDMTLDEAGNAYIADGEGGGIYRVSTDLHAPVRVDSGDFVSPQTPALLPDGKLLVPDYTRGIGVLDLQSHKVSWMPSQGRYALVGIDGLYLFQHTLIATQNGTSPERVARFDLDPKMDHIIAQGVIERATKTLGDPTHGVIVDGYFYYLANSGWDQLDEHAKRKPDSKMEPALLMRARLN